MEPRAADTRRIGMRVTRWWVLTLVVAALTGCSAAPGDGGRPCVGSAIRQGIGVDVAAAYAQDSRSARMTVCQRDDCRSQTVKLRPSSEAVDLGCSNGVCGAKASPTGERHGFVDLPKLKAVDTTVTVELRAADGSQVLRRSIRMRPEVAYPGPTACGGGTPQGNLRVTSDGDLVVRN